MNEMGTTKLSRLHPAPQPEDDMKRKLSMAALIFAMFAGTVGYAAAQDWRYGDRDDNRYYSDRDDYRFDNFRRGMDVARDVGFNDGVQTARADIWNGKPFNPNPRGRLDDADHGYRREFGSIREYREHYLRAYRDGYQSAFNRRGYYR